MMNTVFIYALNCPITGRTRYVGKAVDPQARLFSHISEAKKGGTHRANWIQSLLVLGQRPVLEVLDEVSEEFWPQWEVAYIQKFLEEGFDLVNGTNGGDGITGYRHTLETRESLRGNKNALGAKRSEETRAKMRAGKLGNQHALGAERSEETRAKMRGNKNAAGAERSKKFRMKVSATLQGRKHSEEARANMREAQALRRSKEK